MSVPLVYHLCPAYCLVDLGGGFVALDLVDELTADELALLDRHMQEEVYGAWNQACDKGYDFPPWRFWIRSIAELQDDPEMLLRNERQLEDLYPFICRFRRRPDEWLLPLDIADAVERILPWKVWDFYAELYFECKRTQKLILKTRRYRLPQQAFPVFNPALSAISTMPAASPSPPLVAEAQQQPTGPDAGQRPSESDAEEQQAAAPGEPSTSAHRTAARRLPGEEMNVLARDYLRLHAKQRRVSVKELAEYLAGRNPAGTCSTSTVCKLPAWRAYQDELEQRGLKGKKAKPKMRAFSDVEHAVGQPDAELERLISEQGADYEPSPLEEDPPGRPHRVRTDHRI
ncbi:hypothetical protein JCM19992_22070 [Thermostilla marina]